MFVFGVVFIVGGECGVFGVGEWVFYCDVFGLVVGFVLVGEEVVGEDEGFGSGEECGVFGERFLVEGCGGGGVEVCGCSD